MKKNQPFNNLEKDILDSRIPESYRLELVDFPTEKRKAYKIEEDLQNIIDNNFQLIRNTEKRALENKNLKILLNNLSHLILGNVDWNEENKEEAAKLLYGINFWVLKDGGSTIVDFIIKNDFHVDLVFLFIQLFDKYV